MSLKPAQLQNFFLAGSGVSITDTTMTLASFKSIDGVDLDINDFGTVGYMTVEPGSLDREEQISFTGVTQNANGTATLTGIKSVLFLSPYTESAGFSKSHPSGVIAVVSNTSGYYNNFPIKSNNETITGFWKVPDPIDDTDIANKQYVLSVVNGGPITLEAIIVSGTAGETVSAGQVLYLKESDGRWWKADAAVTATVTATQMGIAQGSGTAGNVITGGVLLKGVDANQSGIVAGTIYYVRNGGGLPSTTPGTISRAIANGTQTATSIYFDPTFDFGALASTTVKGVVEEATQAQVNAGTATGETGAQLFFTPSTWKASTAPTVTTFTSSGTWTKPANLKYAVIELVGGGGGGAGAGSAQAGAGGGGGGYSRKLVAAATLGATETVTIGAAGSAGAAGDNDGGAGGTTSFGSHCSATGGSGGTNNSTAPSPAGGAIGGIGSNGDVNTAGSPGGAAFIMSGVVGAGVAGHGGSSYFGGGANAPSTGQGNDGREYGGGGSGGAYSGSNAAGGAGFKGFIMVTEYYS